MDAITKYKIDIVCLTETKIKGHWNPALEEYVHIWSGVNKSQRSTAGVSIILKKMFKKHVTNIMSMKEY